MTAQYFQSNAEYVIFLVHERFKGICLAGSSKVVDESENGVISRVKSPFHPLRLEWPSIASEVNAWIMWIWKTCNRSRTTWLLSMYGLANIAQSVCLVAVCLPVSAFIPISFSYSVCFKILVKNYFPIFNYFPLFFQTKLKLFPYFQSMVVNHITSITNIFTNFGWFTSLLSSYLKRIWWGKFAFSWYLKNFALMNFTMCSPWNFLY